MIIEDGKGTGYKAKVDSSNRLSTHSVTEQEAAHAVEEGDAYNINTGLFALTSSTASGVVYLKNNNVQDLVIESLIFGFNGLATHADSIVVRVYKNPSTGTLISGASPVEINQNRNFGSSKTLLSSLAYKGAEGATVTDGTEAVLFYGSPNSRLIATLGLLLPQGSSIAVTIDPNISAGTLTMYAAVVCYLKDTNGN